jgi:tetratricopeptide (TPR) repeat protein
MYEYYRADLFMLGAYKAMHEGNNEKIRKGVEQCCNSLERVLEIRPDCKESLLFLVDLYGNLPPEMGGNNEKAEKYLDKLKDVDPLYAAQGELYLADDEVDIVEYWQTYIDEHGKSQESIIKLGNANLQTNNIDQATECFKEVIAEDPSQKELYLQIARAHLYNAMRGGPEGETEIPLIKENIHKYLDMDGEKTTCVEAWCYGWLGMIEERGGNEDQAEIYFNKAKEIMPDFPRYTALPEEDRPPNLVAYQYSSYFSPF